jgi:5'-nucleotidase
MDEAHFERLCRSKWASSEKSPSRSASFAQSAEEPVNCTFFVRKFRMIHVYFWHFIKPNQQHLMKRIAIDMDGVLADVEQAFLARHELETGIRLTFDDIKGKSGRIAFPNVRTWVYEDGFFRNLSVMPESQRVMERLYQQYEVFIVSAATEFPQSIKEKIEWLNEHFPYIGWERMCFCGSKTIIEADIMIDDFFKNLDPFKGDTSILFTQAHNFGQDAGRHQRVQSWLEIEALLLNQNGFKKDNQRRSSSLPRKGSPAGARSF